MSSQFGNWQTFRSLSKIVNDSLKRVRRFLIRNAIFAIDNGRFFGQFTGVNKAIAYQEFNSNIEQMCHWVTYTILASIASVMLFSIFYSVVGYFILDRGIESFHLYPQAKDRNENTPELSGFGAIRKIEIDICLVF